VVFQEAEGFSVVNDSILPSTVSATCLLASFLIHYGISGEEMNRVKTWEWKAMLKMTRSLVPKFDCTLELSGEFWGKNTDA